MNIETIPSSYIIITPSFYKLNPRQKINVRAPQILAKNPRKMSCMHEYFSKNVCSMLDGIRRTLKTTSSQSPIAIPE